jgi:hypothetical protein
MLVSRSASGQTGIAFYPQDMPLDGRFFSSSRKLIARHVVVETPRLGR